MIFTARQSLQKISQHFIFPIKILKKFIFPIFTKNHLSTNDLYTKVICKYIFRKNKLEIDLDVYYPPEIGRDLLNIFFKIKNSFPITNNSIIIGRNSSLNGHLLTIINHLNLKTFQFCKDFNSFLLKLSKVSSIYSMDPSFSLFLFRDSPYLTKLRINCQDELIIAIKIYITHKKIVNLQNFTAYIEQNEIYYTDRYIRQLLHNTGFFEVLGPFTNAFPEDHCIKSRLIAENGHYTVISDKKTHPAFKGISIYRASTKTFFNYHDKFLYEK